jgi:hypothetical protein
MLKCDDIALSEELGGISPGKVEKFPTLRFYNRNFPLIVPPGFATFPHIPWESPGNPPISS